MEETRALFNSEWDNDRVKLAYLVACFTGMREGEILALQVHDIGVDRIFIRHSYSPYEGGLKTPKNGEEREAREGLENLEEEKRIHENTISHVSERIHNVFKFLRKRKFKQKKNLQTRNSAIPLKFRREPSNCGIQQLHLTSPLRMT